MCGGIVVPVMLLSRWCILARCCVVVVSLLLMRCELLIFVHCCVGAISTPLGAVMCVIVTSLLVVTLIAARILYALVASI